MSFRLQIKTHNEAFEHLEAELSRILRAVADKLDALDGRKENEAGRCMDFNGNHVGGWQLDID